MFFFFKNGLRGYAAREPQTVAVVADVVSAVADDDAVIVEGDVIIVVKFVCSNLFGLGLGWKELSCRGTGKRCLRRLIHCSVWIRRRRQALGRAIGHTSSSLWLEGPPICCWALLRPAFP